MKKVEIVEVGPRDGLQNEARTLDVGQRLEFIDHLVASGLRRIEVGAFVSPKWVPQMDRSGEVIAQLVKKHPGTEVRFSALTPNVRGIEAALRTEIPEVAIFGACSEGFSKHNTNCTIAEGLERFETVIARAGTAGRRVRGYLSVAFGCPYEGQVPEEKVVELVKRYLDMGVFEVSIGDTIGVATPRQVRSVLGKLEGQVDFAKLALHFHDTRGTALANVLAGLEHGIGVYDSSFGGLGGCPYARGASGNLATEDLVYMLDGMGYSTGVDLAYLLDYVPKMQQAVGRKLPSRTAEAGLPKLS